MGGQFVANTPAEIGLNEFDALRMMTEERGHDNDWAWAMMVARLGVESRIAPEKIIGLLIDERNPVSVHCRSKRDPKIEAIRIFNRANTELENIVAPIVDNISLEALDLVALSEIEPAPVSWALENFCPAGEMVLFTGPGSSGKSLLGQQLATCAAASLPLMGVNVAPCNAMYLSCEDSERELHWRQKHICAALDLPMSDLDGFLHLFSLRGRLGNELCTFDKSGRLIPSTTYGLIEEKIIEAGAKLVILDNVGHLFTGNENDRGNVTQFANLLNRLAGETGATIVLLAHPNKSGDDYSGSTAWLNAVRAQIMIDYQRGGDNEIVDPDIRVLSLGKANYARKGTRLEFRWHNFTFVLPQDIPSGRLAELHATAQATRDNEVFLKCLAQRNHEKRAVSATPCPNYAPTQFLQMPETKGISKKRLIDAMNRLFRIGQIEQGFLWRNTEKGRNVEGLRLVKSDPQTDAPNGPQTPTPSDP